MHNPVHWFIAKNQEHSINYENKEDISFLGHDNLGRGKEEKI